MKKARFFKFSLVIVIILLFILSLGAFLFIYNFPKEKVLALVTAKAEKTLKRKVVIGEINYGLKGVTLDNILIYNNMYTDSDIPDSDILASIKSGIVSFSLLPLLNKQLIINKILLNNFRINIHYDNGKSNLENLLHDIESNGDSGIHAKISSVRFEDSEIILKESPEVLKPLEGRYVFNGTLNFLLKEYISIRDCDISLPDNRGKIRSKDIRIAVKNNDFEVSGDFRLNHCSLLWVYTWSDNLELPYTNFTGEINNLVVSRNQVKGFAAGKSILKNSKTVNVDGQCKVNIQNKTVELINLKGNIDRSEFFINALKFSWRQDLQNRLIRFSISDIDSDINDMKSILSFLPAGIYGGVSGKLSYENKKYNGSLDLKNVTYMANGEPLLSVNAEIPINDNVIHIEKIPALIYKQPCQVSISTSGNNLEKIILNIYSKEFRYNVSKASAADINLSKTDIQSEITGRLEVENLYINDYKLSDVFVNYAFAKGVFNFNRIVCKFMGGDISSNGYVDTSRDNIYVDFAASFEEIKVQNIVSLKNEYSGRFFGLAMGNADFEFSVKKGASLYDSLKGKMEVTIDKGKLVNTGIQKGLSIWLSELEYKLKDLEFSKIYGNFNIIGNNFYVNSMLFKAPDIRLMMDGYFKAPDMGNLKLPGDMKILLQFNDYFIQDIPNLPQTQLLSKLVKIPALKKKGDWYEMSFQTKGDDILDSKNLKPL